MLQSGIGFEEGEAAGDGYGEGNCGKRDNHFRLEKHALAPHMDSLQDEDEEQEEMVENEDNKYPTYTQLQLKYFPFAIIIITTIIFIQGVV